MPNAVRLAFAVSALLVSLPAFAQAPAPTLRVRGTLTAVSPEGVDIATREGPTVHVAFAIPKVNILDVVPISAADIKPGSFIGTAAMPRKDGTLSALEVVVAAPGTKGREGYFAWDLQPDSMMANGTVGDVTTTDGRTMTVNHGDGVKTVVIPEGTPIVTLKPADAALLVKDAKVMVFASKAADGTLTANAIAVGQNGAAPPM